MGLFSRKPAYCTICNKQVIHKNKAKREWGCLLYTSDAADE